MASDLSSLDEALLILPASGVGRAHRRALGSVAVGAHADYAHTMDCNERAADVMGDQGAGYGLFVIYRT